jgi:predicted RND superfamily exporter protein
MFDKTFKEGLPAKKANRILWDFYQQVWKSKVNKGVGFANSKDPDSKVKYIWMTFSVPMKRRAYYTPSEFESMYTKVKNWAVAVPAPSYVGKPAMSDTDLRRGKWMWMNTQQLYLKYAVWGIFVAILLAFFVLCIATNNIIISGLAVLTIGCVVSCVVGTMYLAGWELGNIESICLTILAGFCVDYIVHLAHAYVECPDTSSRLLKESMCLNLFMCLFTQFYLHFS